MLNNKEKDEEVISDVIHMLAQLELLMDRSGLLPEEIITDWQIYGRSGHAPRKQSEDSQNITRSEILKRVERLEKIIEPIVGRSVFVSPINEKIRGMIDVLVQETFSKFEYVSKILVATKESEITYHIFLLQGNLGKHIRHLMKKAVEIEDIFEDMPIDFRIHDERLVTSLNLDDCELLYSKEGKKSDESQGIQQVSSP